MTERQDSAEPREFVAFTIGAQEFCVDIMAVREIRGWTPETGLPRAPAYVRGVINLRGAVLPIVDLSARLGRAATDPTPRHVIVVGLIGDRVAGILVDAVSEILNLGDKTIQPAPEVGAENTKTFVRGLMALEGRMISVITLDNLFAPDFQEAA